MKALMMCGPYAKVHGIYRGLGDGFGCADFATLRSHRSHRDDSAVGYSEVTIVVHGEVI